jgi:hypothetical protein
MSPEMEQKVKVFLANTSECWPEASAIAFRAMDLLEQIIEEEKRERYEA